MVMEREQRFKTAILDLKRRSKSVDADLDDDESSGFVIRIRNRGRADRDSLLNGKQADRLRDMISKALGRQDLSVDDINCETLDRDSSSDDLYVAYWLGSSKGNDGLDDEETPPVSDMMGDENGVPYFSNREGRQVWVFRDNEDGTDIIRVPHDRRDGNRSDNVSG